ncbi:MAG: sugar ABC transporter ATP-binding protein, partial [Nonomuraea sp.]|nr:sugar ABC transporter ATP-binding protein [Nonomuraea sp.]
MDTQLATMLATRELAKSYGGVRALVGADIALRGGSIHALLGENGAGKSTLVKILAGAVAPDGGELLLEGRPVRFASTVEAARNGVAIVSQELSLFPDQDVLSNLFVHALPTRGLLVNRASMAARARPVLAELGLTLPVDTLVESLSLSDRQLVEIARALVEQPKVLILDEPTSALQATEVTRLHHILGRLRERGTAIVYVSHVLEDVLAICDEVTVLRDGAVVRNAVPVKEMDIPAMVAAMLGDKLAAAPAARGREIDPAPDAPLLRLNAVSAAGRLREVTLEARAGEVVGLAGLDGSGHRDVLHVVAGSLPLTSGAVDIPGGRPHGTGVRQAVKSGVGLISGDRRGVGLMGDKPIWENVIQVSAVSLGRLGAFLPESRLRATARPLVDRLRVRSSSVDQYVDELSGGNQQKVVFAKWLAAEPSVLLMDDPTRGIDVGAKAEIYELMNELARGGTVQLLVSSDPKELAEVCDRVV